MSNRLAGETSPYLLQHKDNPVDWYPWGPEALERAATEDRPILLSIGYSSCHWCHVMAHESFENEAIAKLMNDNFVCIKVDREERPDLDAVYMDAVQAMTGHGGWPMTVFLTPDGVPFFAGTYFPAFEGRGMTSFPRVLTAVSRAYREQREKVGQSAVEMKDFLQKANPLPHGQRELDLSILDEAAHNLLNELDRVNGGTLGAPKFPQPMTIEFMLKQYKRTGDVAMLAMAELSLQKMAQGGIYDQLGGGFHRYSVDDVWLVPHFEKMLYDNSLLARVYLAAYQITGNSFYRRVAEETLDYLLREMTSPEGGFYSSQDADSEGEEGKFYVWSHAEVLDALGPKKGKLFSLIYDVTPRGNFEGKSILHIKSTPGTVAAATGLIEADVLRVLEESQRKLFAMREARVRPGRDDKIVVAWNGLALRAFAEAASILDRDDYRQAALRNAQFVTSTLRREVDGTARLLRTYKDSKAQIEAFAEDYASYASGLLSLYEATFDAKWVEIAVSLVGTLMGHFRDEGGGFYSTSDFHEILITRPKELYDNAVPSANSEAAETLVRLYLLTAASKYEQEAIETMQPFAGVLSQAPLAFGRMLSALDFYLSNPAEVALVGDLDSAAMKAMLGAVWKQYVPNKVVAGRRPDDVVAERIVPLLEARGMVKGQPTAYVCRNYVCEAPTTDPGEVARLLAGGTSPVN